MQIQVDIGFEELLKLVKALPSSQLKKMRTEIERTMNHKQTEGLESVLLNGPVATKKQLDTIEDNRKAINQWRSI